LQMTGILNTEMNGRHGDGLGRVDPQHAQKWPG
jgi:hypothetical protein